MLEDSGEFSNISGSRPRYVLVRRRMAQPKPQEMLSTKRVLCGDCKTTGIITESIDSGFDEFGRWGLTRGLPPSEKDGAGQIASIRLPPLHSGHRSGAPGLAQDGGSFQRLRTRSTFFLCLGGDAQHFADRARKRLRQVEAAEAHPDAMDGVQSADDCNDSQLIQMDEALAKLGEHYPQCSEMVHLRFFVGLSNQEIAKVLSSSERTVKRKLAFAKAFLAKVLLKHSAGATP